MQLENIELRKAKQAKGDDLQKGVADLTVKDIGLDLKNIPYRVTKEKEILVTAPGVSFATKVAKGEKPINTLIPTISFHDASIWDAIVEAIKQKVSKTIDD